MDNFIVQLMARLDSSKTPDDLRKIEQQLNARGIEIKPIINSATTQKELKNLAKQLQNVLKAEGVNVDTSAILSALKKAQKAVDEANKAQQEGTKENIRLRKQELENIKQKNKELAAETDSIKKSTANAKARHQQEIEAIEAERRALAEKRKLENEKSRTSTRDNEIRRIGALAGGGVKNDYSTQIAKIQGDFRSLGVTETEIANKTQKVSTALQTLKTELAKPVGEQSFDAIKAANDAVQRELAETSNEYEKLRASAKGYATEQQRLTLANTIEAWNQKNTAATKAVLDQNNKYIASLRELDVTMDRMSFDAIKNGFKKAENSMRGLGKLGASFRNQMKQAAESFTQWISVSTAIMTLVHKTTQAIGELKEVDTLLTEISKANDKLTKSQLNSIGNQAYDTASKYGLKATDYLSGVREMSRAGYQNADAMAELAVKAQGAGDMTDEVTNSFIVATDKAYQLNGSVGELTRIMDGINYITNHNAINMTELSEGFSIVASTAASFGVEADELTAALATMGSATQQSGSEVARAFRAILLNIRQVSDADEGIDAEGLTKYEKACNALGVSLKETKNGVLQTRDAMEVLEELSEAYNKLDENDLRRTELLNSVGGKLRATQLDALLKNFDTYKTMLGQFESGMGSMEEEAAKTADSMEGRLNTLHNKWVKFVETIADTDSLKSAVSVLTSLLTPLQGIATLLDSISSIGILNGAGGMIGAISGLVMATKGHGKLKFHSGRSIAPTPLRLYNNAI